MLFTQQVLHLECLFWLFEFFNVATWVYFCVYPVFYWGSIVENFLPKAGVLGKKDKNGGDGDIGGFSLGGGIQTFYTLWSMVLFFHIVHLFSDELN